MKLLSKDESRSTLKKDNEELVETNIRLRKYYKDIVHKLNTVKETYEPEKLKKLEEFEKFCKDLHQKKSLLLEELQGLVREIENKKDVYYGLVTKQDLLEEKVHQMQEQSRKLDLREAFVVDLERKFREKTT